MNRTGIVENKKLLYSKLTDMICEYIKENNLKPGDKMPGERKLAKEWKVSRATLREAIRELENEGIVHVEVGKGTFVTDYVAGTKISIHLALKNFLELFEMKTVLERYSLEKAIPGISEEKLDYLEQLAVQMNVMAQHGIIPEEIDHTFHEAIMECHGNTEMTNMVRKLTQMYEAFDDKLYSYFNDINFDYKSVLLQTFPYHLEIVHMMRKGDIAGALENFDKIVELDLTMYARIE